MILHKKNELKIMLVEDDPAHAEIALRTLKKAPIKSVLLHFTDGQEAIEYIRSQEWDWGNEAIPDIVLLDLRLPRIDGIEFLRLIKADLNFRKIPIVVLTTSEADSDIEKAYKYGAASYLVKPIDSQKYLSLIKNFGYYWLNTNMYPRKEEYAND